ncbi:hypothetical protein BDP55DRAFT_551337 [Colletotrichum godetiae]|uniref:Uncharacterized protein n=1 Tax=Colletotrichum godetiae TaxID=1209918 RepID=A0AAJ0ALT0_9PEZI|nr:uncharacterized protein BDP55DRAFT_551337 [Colletotrichum godetiae]KAK1676263.1 hypothetical protein BDP55DRAFT_551337 [Colletotrichum godetiae]
MTGSKIGNYEDINQKLWYRKFIRGVKPRTKEPYPDEDTPATPEQLDDDFVDYWGRRLKADKAFRKHNTYNELMTQFWEDPNIILQTYAVADGQTVPRNKQKPWFRSELRFISVIFPTDANHKKDAKAPIGSVSWAPWFVLIAASSSIHSEKDILHIMSWSREDGQFRYYARDLIMNDEARTQHGWVYLCSSMDAFDAPGKAYLGPLNGHVNGGIIMKEIHKPWMHWLVGGRGVMDLLDAELISELTEARWLTYPGFPPLYGASVQSGETFERIVLDSLRIWFTSRRNKDFLTEKGETKKRPDNIQRWAAHFFLTTNINIAATSNNANIVPSDHFFNYEMLRGYSDLLPNRSLNDDQWLAGHILKETPAALTAWNKEQFKNDEHKYLTQEQWFRTYSISSFKYDGLSYLWASRELKLCTLQEVANVQDAQLVVPANILAGGIFMGTLEDGKEDIRGGAQVNFAVQQWGEGDNPWVILQSSVDDAHGVWTAQKMFLGDDKQSARCQLFSEKTFNALQMVDFWNPIYSWRRLKLMQYIPVEAELLDTPTTDSTTGDYVYSYNLEENFIDAVRKRMDGKGDLEELQDEWPEAAFLCNLDKPLIEHQIRISNYTNKVVENLNNATWILDYLKLAESRRRMFRPMPMNFFGSNIPYCLAMPTDHPWIEMTEKAFVRQIPESGLDVLKDWLGSLASSDPSVIPNQSLGDLNKLIRENVEQGTVGLPVCFLPRPSTMRMACQRFIAVTNPETSERPHSCPFMV